MSRTMHGEAERRSADGDGYEFRDSRDVSRTDERQSKRKPELPYPEAEDRPASINGKSLRPSRDQQTEDRDEEQDGGHTQKIGVAPRPLHP
jgi:hypothetical protein